MVARIVEQLGGQLRVDSRVDEGSRFSLLIPLATEPDLGSSGSSHRSRTHQNEIESLVSALQSHPHPMTGSPVARSIGSNGSVGRSVASSRSDSAAVATLELAMKPSRNKLKSSADSSPPAQLRILIVEVCIMSLHLFHQSQWKCRITISIAQYWRNV